MVENDMCLGGTSKQNALFPENVHKKKQKKTHPCPKCLE